MEEITSFIKGAICDDQCLGRCLYIHGVPGTGKVCISGRLWLFSLLLDSDFLSVPNYRQ